MSAMRKALQAFMGILLAAVTAAAVGTWLFPLERDGIFTAGPLNISVTGIGAGLSLISLLAFANGWIGVRKRNGSAGGAGLIWDGLGFGLLPSLAVWKCFEQMTVLGRGNAVPEGLAQNPWLTEGGNWQPCRIELVLALALFACLVIWLMLRRSALPENGDLMGVSCAMWCAVRLVTDGFRMEQLPLMGNARISGWLFAGIMLIVLILWSGRAMRMHQKTGYMLACWPVLLAAVAVMVLTRNQIIRTGNAVADMIMICCAALLGLKAVLCMGRVTR